MVVKTILLVEDQGLVAVAQKKGLEDYGYHVLVAQSGKKAVEKVRAHADIDLVLMDVDLGRGKMDGTEAAKIILEERDLPILFLSSHTERDIVEKTERITSYGYVVKESGITVLDASIKMALKLHAAHHRLEDQEKLLKESEKRYRGIFENSPTGIYRTSPGGRYLSANQATASFLGYESPEDLIVSVTDIGAQVYASPEDRAFVLRRLTERGSIHSFEARFLRKDGAVTWGLLSARAVRDENGNLLYIDGTSQDITELREAQGKIAQLSEFREKIFDSTDAHLAVVDRTGKIVEVNRAWQQFALENGAGNEGAWGRGSDYFRACMSDGEDAPSLQALQGIRAVQLGHLPSFEMEYSCHSPTLERWFRMRVRPVTGSPGMVLIAHTDVTNLVAARMKLNESAALAKALLDLPRDNVVVLIDKNGVLLDFNESLCERLGIERDKLLGKCVFDFLPPDVAGSRRKNLKRVLQSLKPGRLIDTDGQYHWEHVVYPIPGERGEADKAAVFSYDITALKKAEDGLREREQKYRSIFENAVEGFYQVTPEGRYLSANPALARMYGYESPEELMNSVTSIEKDQYVVPQDRTRLKTMYAAQGFVEGFETQMYCKDRSVIWISINARAVRSPDGAILYYEGSSMDITSKKTAEEQIRSSLREKEALLKEVHHRVKNNLQIMSSLLSLQSQYVDDGKSLAIFKDSMNRVKTMALIHDKLYRSDNLSHIYFPGYVSDLTRDLISIYAGERSIYLNLDIKPIFLDIDMAVPLGLIVNELTSNALKHAFPGSAGGTVRIGLYAENGKTTLVVSDTGIGFPRDLDFTNTPSMGMQLVVTLVEQIEGTIELSRDKGTEFRITFATGR